MKTRTIGRLFEVKYPNGTIQQINVPYDGNLLEQVEKLKEYILTSIKIEVMPDFTDRG